MIVGDGDPGVELAAAGEGETALLDGSEHTDTEAASPEVGGLIVAAAAAGEPVKWRKLSPGDEGQVLRMVSGLPTWSTSAGGAGDMTKAVYDTDDDGVVDAAENAAALGGHAPSYFEVAVAAAAERADHEADYAHANLPSADQKAALAGTSGTPGSGNKYVTDDDPRLTLGGLSKWLDEDFDGLTDGDISGQGDYDGISAWAHDFSGNATAEVVSSGGEKFLRLYQPAITALDKRVCYLDFTDMPGLNWVRIHFKWKTSDVDKSGDAGLQFIASDGSTILFHLYFQQATSKIVAYNGSNVYTIKASVADDTYYEFDMIYCLLEASGTGYAQIWVDGTYAGRFPGRGTAAYCPQRMSFFVGNAVHSLESSLAVDDLKVWSLFRQ